MSTLNFYAKFISKDVIKNLAAIFQKHVLVDILQLKCPSEEAVVVSGQKFYFMNQFMDLGITWTHRLLTFLASLSP